MSEAYDFAADIILGRQRINWRPIQGNEDPDWDLSRVLYAYVTLPPLPVEILYVGKAWSKTVAERFDADDKDGFWRDLWRQRRIGGVEVIVGLPQARVLTHPLLCDMESLLIHFVRPCTQNTLSRGWSRDGFGVHCAGAW